MMIISIPSLSQKLIFEASADYILAPFGFAVGSFFVPFLWFRLLFRWFPFGGWEGRLTTI